MVRLNVQECCGLPPAHNSCSPTGTCVSAGQKLMHQWMKECPIGNSTEGQPWNFERQVISSEVQIPVVSCHGYRLPKAMYNFFNGRTVPVLQNHHGKLETLPLT